LKPVSGPYFEDLSVGQVFSYAPPLTLTEGRAAAHQAIVGDRLRLALDDELSTALTGEPGFAHPALVWDVAIGQSTIVTQHVKANLFYRGLAFHRAPHLGDTLRTTTEIVGLRQNQPKEGRAATGLAALRITTVDQHDRKVLDFWRCAMLPLGNPAGTTGHRDDLDEIGAAASTDFTAPSRNWNLDAFDIPAGVPRFVDLVVGGEVDVAGADVVTNAPELARLTLNVAAVHHDTAAAGGERLVYGGHTIGIALSQCARAVPSIVTVAGWHSCDHLAPVHEGDRLQSTLGVDRLEPLVSGGLAHLRSQVYAGPNRTPVLDWRFVAVVA
jgi:acyl dehydratase